MSEHMYPDKNVMWQSDRVTDTSSWEAVFGRGRIKHQLYVDLHTRLLGFPSEHLEFTESSTYLKWIKTQETNGFLDFSSSIEKQRAREFSLI